MLEIGGDTFSLSRDLFVFKIRENVFPDLEWTE